MLAFIHMELSLASTQLYILWFRPLKHSVEPRLTVIALI